MELKLYYKDLETAQKNNPNCIITECKDYEYLEYIQKIKELSTDTLLDCKGREVLKIPISNGIAYVKIMNEDNLDLDCVQYQIHNNNQFINPITWAMGSPEELYKNILNIKPIKFKVYKFRKYGQPKLPKPKELNKIKVSFSVDFIPNKCKCQCFIKDNDLWIKHRDFFSEEMKYEPEDFGTPLEYRARKYLDKNKSNKFVYPDAWGSIVCRNEAWIIFENIIPQVKLQSQYELTRNMVKEFARKHMIDWRELDNEWERFFENIVKELNKIGG